MKIHVGFIKEGTILHFPNSVYDYMKVCDRNEIGGRVPPFLQFFRRYSSK